MRINPILGKLRVLGLEGMRDALGEQLNTPEAQKLGFEKRVGLMVDREAPHRKNRRLKSIGWPRPGSGMTSEDIDYRQKPGHGQATHHGPGLMPMDRRTLQPAHQQTHRRRYVDSCFGLIRK
ncbi:hypothetical protein DFAR_2410003 [Desulfarculales bacterium]